MFARLALTVAAAATLASGLAEPVQAQSARDRAYCDDVATRAAWRRNSNAVGEGAVVGAVTGGVLGAILGKGKGKNIVGGAIAGTAAGAVLGAAGQGRGTIDRRAYRIAYADCIEDRLDGRPALYSDSVRYCMAKYRSYNPRTGLYLTYGGTYRHCP
jgi:uncharacterized protein YcfJ